MTDSRILRFGPFPNLRIRPSQLAVDAHQESACATPGTRSRSDDRNGPELAETWSTCLQVYRAADVITSPPEKIRHGRTGRPLVPKETRDLIRTMSQANPLWERLAFMANS